MTTGGGERTRVVKRTRERQIRHFSQPEELGCIGLTGTNLQWKLMWGVFSNPK